MEMSLDEFIRRKQAGQSNNGYKKQKEEIDKDQLDAELDMIATGKAASLAVDKSKRSSLSKFERLSLSDFDEEDDEPISTQNSSIQFAKAIEKMDHPHCCKFKPFTTIEDKTKVKVKSQQWRLGANSNPDTARNSNVSSVRGGRVRKNYRNNSGNNNVVRGNFTYKLQNGDEKIAGIVRNNRKRITYDEPPAYEEVGEQILLHKAYRDDMLINCNITNLVRNGRLQLGSLLTPQPQYLTPPPQPIILQPPQSVPIPKSQSGAQITINLDTDDLYSFLAFKKKMGEKKATTESSATATVTSEKQDIPSLSDYERDALGGDDIAMDSSDTY